jgi:molecular chaperone DnaJ
LIVKDYYQLLGVESEASDEEIKKAYRKLAMENHPDRNWNKPGCEELIKDLNEAYQVLGNNEERRRYDLLRQQPYINHASYQRNLSDDLMEIIRVFSRVGAGAKGFGGCRGMGLGLRGCRRRKRTF